MTTAFVAVVAVAAVGYLSLSALWGAVAVSTAPMQSNVREQVFGLGTVGSRIQSDVGFKVTGVLVALKADQGDRVRAGQVLARLDARDVDAQLDVARAGVALARANLANAIAIAKRRTALLRSGATAIEEAQTTRAAARVAEAALQSARAQEAFEEATLANYTLHAPFDALVVSRNLELGSLFSPQSAAQSVFTLVAARSVWVEAYVDERLAGRIRVGQHAEIALRSMPGRRFAGHVARIEIKSDPVNEERSVDVAFDRIPQTIHLAEQAEVRITTSTLAHAVLVQPSTVADFRGDYGAGGQGTVWTVEADRIGRLKVTFGSALLDGRLPIVDGLPPGAAVVTAPMSGLRVGRAATLVKELKP